MRTRILFVLCSIAAAFPAGAATICVHPTSMSCQTSINTAIGMAAAGDTIKIAPGTYFESVVVPAGKDGLILLGGNPKTTIIDSYLLAGESLDISSNNVQVLGLGIAGDSDVGILVNGNGFIIKRSKITQPDAGDCLEIIGDSAVVEGNYFFGCGDNAVDLDGVNGIIKRNRVLHADGGCMEVQTASNNVRIEGNILEGCEDDDAIDILASTGAVILSNRVYGAERLAELTSGSHNATVQRNIVAGSEGLVSITGNTAIVSGNRSTGTGDNDGIFVSGNDALIEKNVITGQGQSEAVQVTGNNPRVLSNTVTGANDEDAIDVTCTTCTTALVERNRVVGGSDDMSCFDLDFASNGGIVRYNSARFCTDRGFDIEGDGAVLVERNTSSHSGSEGEHGFEISGTGVKTLLSNLSQFASGSGFFIEEGAHVLTKNTAKDNAKDGFQIQPGMGVMGVVLTGNRATGNSQEGIDSNADMNAVTMTDNTAKLNRKGSDVCSVNVFVDNGGNDFGSTTTTCIDN